MAHSAKVRGHLEFNCSQHFRANVRCQYGCNLRNTHSSFSNCTSWLFLFAVFFIRSRAIDRCSLSATNLNLFLSIVALKYHWLFFYHHRPPEPEETYHTMLTFLKQPHIHIRHLYPKPFLSRTLAWKFQSTWS